MADQLSVVDRVKKRLAQNQDAEQTQVIPDFSKSILFQQPSASETQPNQPPQSTQSTQPLQAVKLPQLQLDESDFLQPTQVIKNVPSQGTQAIQDSTLTQDLAADHKTQHTRQLENEILHVSLTDEENDLNEHAETTLDSSVQKNITTKSELEKIDRDMSEQKRLRTIKPAFQASQRNPVQDLLDAFDSDQENEMASGAETKSSPTTSPIKETAKRFDESDSASDLELENIIDVISKVPESRQTQQKRTPIDEYARRLKNSLITKTSPVIDLEESEDESAENPQSEDDIPKLSKEKDLLLKQKFSKRRLANKPRSSTFQQTKSQNNHDFFSHLRRANAKQLADIRRANPDLELIEEIEKEEEEMGNLLEREMERARRIRKKEKAQEKANLPLSEENADADYQENATEAESDVPDSDGMDEYDSEVPISGSEEDDGEPAQTKRKRARQVITSDEETGHEENWNHERVESNHAPGRNDDSYMFGGPDNNMSDHDEEDPIMHINSDLPLPESPMDPEMNKQVVSMKPNSPRLFQNLAPRNTNANSSMITNEDSSYSLNAVDSFRELEPTQVSNVTLETQVDNFPDQSTQVDSQWLTQNGSEVGEQKDEFLEKNTQRPLENISESDDETEQNEEEMKQKLALYEAKIRRKEMQSRKRRKEIERRSKGIIEGEAEESEDEWKGVGGADMEVSDQADSEDERMIDNTLNIDLNDEEIRRKFMEQYQIKDRAELEKLIDDVHNHKLTKRARGNRFDIELSDEEDEILMAYRQQKLEEQKQRLLANQKLSKNSKNDKCTAFFQSIDEDADPFIINEESDSDVNHDYDDSQENRQTEEPRKKIVIEESFVQKQLSFLSKNDDDYAQIQEQADKQHGIEDLSALKNRCMNSLYSNSISEESKKRPVDEVATDEDDGETGFNSFFKKPSVVSSFKAFHDKKGVQVSTKSFSGVTVNKQYKTATGSKASISYMSKKTKNELPKNFKSSRLEEIERQLEKVRSQSGMRPSVSDTSFS